MRMVRLVRNFVLTLLMITVCGGAFAQQSEEGVFAPFVSRLRLAINDPQVRITWEPAPGSVGGYLIYRSDSEITTDTLAEAELLGRVDSGSKSYLDVPLERGSYHYAVLVEAANGNPIRFVIPGRNASFRPVEVTELATDLERSAVLRGLDATVADARTVELSVDADRGGRTLAIYRSTSPIRSTDDLSEATLFREVASESTIVEDFPVPGVEYYYAAVDTARVLAGEVELETGRNTTATAIALPLAVAQRRPDQPTATQQVETRESDSLTDPAGEPTAEPNVARFELEPLATSIRALPLPFLQLQTRLSSDVRLRDPRFVIGERRDIGSGTGDAIRSLVNRTTAGSAAPAGPSVLEVDTLGNPSGADYTLQTILDGPFARMAWEQALVQINNFFSLPLTDDLQARAHYYRAQLYYELGDSRAALLEFLLARDRYYPESEAWIRHILSSDND